MKNNFLISILTPTVNHGKVIPQYLKGIKKLDHIKGRLKFLIAADSHGDGDEDIKNLIPKHTIWGQHISRITVRLFLAEV